MTALKNLSVNRSAAHRSLPRELMTTSYDEEDEVLSVNALRYLRMVFSCLCQQQGHAKLDLSALSLKVIPVSTLVGGGICDLDLSFNALHSKQLEIVISFLYTSLEALSIRSNALDSWSLPERALLTCTALAVLNISGNEGLSLIPPCVGRMPSLTEIDVTGCTLAVSELPRALFNGQNTSATCLRYFRQLEMAASSKKMSASSCGVYDFSELNWMREVKLLGEIERIDLFGNALSVIPSAPRARWDALRRLSCLNLGQSCPIIIKSSLTFFVIISNNSNIFL